MADKYGKQIKFPLKFYNEVKRIAEVECRSPGKQLTYWATIGMAVTQDPEAMQYLRDRGLLDA